MSAESTKLKLGLPKGRMEAGVTTLLADAGVKLRSGPRRYRPHISLPNVTTKVLKPQNVVEMLHHGSRDVGFAGADWAAELNVELVELLDTEMDPVTIVAAAPEATLENGALPKRPLTIASEYERLTKKWIKEQGLDAKYIRSNGATEVFPPEDADAIIDNSATGETLRANNLTIVDELLKSSTRFYANPKALEVPEKRETIDRLVLLLNGVLLARKRVLVTANVGSNNLDDFIAILPAMRAPTVAPLRDGEGFGVTVAIPKSRLAELLPEMKARGGSDIVVTKLTQIMP